MGGEISDCLAEEGRYSRLSFSVGESQGSEVAGGSLADILTSLSTTVTVTFYEILIMNHSTIVPQYHSTTVDHKYINELRCHS